MTYHLIYSDDPYGTLKQKVLDDYHYFLSISTKTNNFEFLNSDNWSPYAYSINFSLSYLSCYLHQIMAKISEVPNDHQVVWIKLIGKTKTKSDVSIMMNIHPNSILHKLPVNSVHSSGDNLEDMFNNFISFMKILEVHSV